MKQHGRNVHIVRSVQVNVVSGTYGTVDHASSEIMQQRPKEHGTLGTCSCLLLQAKLAGSVHDNCFLKVSDIQLRPSYVSTHPFWQLTHSAASSVSLNCDKQIPHRSTTVPSKVSFSFTLPSFKMRRRCISILPTNGTEALSNVGELFCADPANSASRSKSCNSQSERIQNSYQE